MSKLTQAREILSTLLEAAQVDAGHGIVHAEIVLGHANRALELEELSDTCKEDIRLAALLHDADDGKFFPDNDDYQNARYTLEHAGCDLDQAERVIEMIGLVSCSKNGDSPVKPEYKLIPRYADRLEALGRIGIIRCYQYTVHKKRPVFVDSTPRVKTVSELEAIACPERFQLYRGNSLSMVDHYYDKLLHLANMHTSNRYLLEESKRRHQVMVDFCLEFGRTGVVDEQQIKDWIAEQV